MRRDPFLSVVFPVFNESEVIDISFKAFKETLDKFSFAYEVVAVDDGSTDDSFSKLENWADLWPELKVLSFISNKGHMAAITAGLKAASGDWVVTIDVDLQDPPDVIPKMLDLAKSQNVDVVYGIRGDRKSDTWFKRTTAKFYYKLIGRVTGIEVPIHAADCRLMSRRVVNELCKFPEIHKVYRLLVPWLGFPSQNYKYTRNERAAGKTHYNLRKMVVLAWTSITSFSAAPLRIAIWIGFVGILSMLIISGYVLVGWLSGEVYPGWTSLMLVVLFLGSLQLLSLGILGEYVSKLYSESQRRPLYILKEPIEDQNK
jgi:glycosyltransferase involved in cell wall biosynthesis